jgi:hypothetical protein
MRRTIIGVLVAACLLVGVGRAQAQPSATIDVDGWVVGAGIGFQGVEGVLTFEGQTYPVTILATNFITVGAAWLYGSAQVFGMNRLEELAGTYSGGAFGATFIAGGHGGRFAGSNGIEIATEFFSLGIDLQGAIQQIRVIVHESNGRPAPYHYWPGRSTIDPVH